MRVRKIKKDGYKNGKLLAKSWESEGLMPCPVGEVIEDDYRLVNWEYARKSKTISRTGVNINLAEVWKKRIKKAEDKKAQNNIKSLNEEELLDYVDDLQQVMINNNPDGDEYPEVQEQARYKKKEAQGIAEIYNTDYRRVLLCKDMFNRPLYEMVTENKDRLNFGNKEKCTTIIFKKSPYGPVIGRNMDAGIDSLPGLQGYGEPSLYEFPEDMGYNFISIAQINEKGLMIQGSGISYPHELLPKREFMVNGYSLILRYCKTVSEALEMIKKYNKFFFPAPSNLIVLDSQGNAAVIEKAKNTFAVRKEEGKDTIFTTSGAAVEEKTSKIQGKSKATIFARKRYQLINKLLLEKEEINSLGVQDMWDIISNHDKPSPVCRHPEVMPDYASLTTMYSFVLVPREETYYFKVIKPGPVYPCQQEADTYSYAFNVNS